MKKMRAVEKMDTAIEILRELSKMNELLKFSVTTLTEIREAMNLELTEWYANFLKDFNPDHLKELQKRWGKPFYGAN